MNTINTIKRKSDGIKWGPFTLRIPFIHIQFRSAEFLQGLVISGATAFAAAPLAMKLGLTFEEASCSQHGCWLFYLFWAFNIW